jgi:hypothetical protein
LDVLIVAFCQRPERIFLFFMKPTKKAAQYVQMQFEPMARRPLDVYCAPRVDKDANTCGDAGGTAAQNV